MNGAGVARRNPYDDFNTNKLQSNDTSDGRVITSVDQNLYDDLYDFHDIPLDDGLIIHRGGGLQSNGGGMMHGTDEDTDEDINLDYEYGYDYEKIIKDRLKAVNDAFINDSTPPNKKNTRVSFDTAVTAFQTDLQTQSVDEMNTIQDSTPPTPNSDYHEILEQKPSSPETGNEHAVVAKIPLNDTVKKENPDEFQNKLKEIVAKYDAEHKPEVIEHHTKPHHFPEDKEDDESELFFLKYKPVRNHSLDNSEAEIVNTPPATVINSVTVAPPKKKSASFAEQPNNDNNNTTNVNNNRNSPVDLNKTNKANSPSPTSSRAMTPSNENSNKNSNFSFSASSSASKLSVTSPKPNNKNNNDNSNNSSSRNSPVPSSSNNNKNAAAETTTTTKTSDRSGNSSPSNKNNKNQDKVLIERDGKFLYVNSDEYTAKEKARREAEAAKSKPPFLPHPPTRPKTSNGRNNHRQVTAETKNNNSNKTQSAKNLSINIPRQSHSADPRGRSEQRAAIQDERTPEYAETYKSPYALSPRRAESQQGERLSKIDRKKREKEEAEERRRINESAFNAWLENKLNQHREDANKRKQEKAASNSSRSDESKTSYESWLNKKKEQLLKDKEYEKKLKELQSQDEEYKPTIREREIAFRRWLKEKLKAKKEVKKVEKLERKKWAATCRRSRKHQRLSQAIELAQIYGYTSYYYTTGFKF